MYGDMELIEEMKAELNKVSPSFCMAKWKHLTLHLATGHAHSCYLPPTHKVSLDEIKKDPSALHNSSQKKMARKMMKEGKRPDECSVCWKVEDLPGNHYSDRHYRGIDDWTLPYFHQVKKMNWDENINPSYLELSFGNTCNFKCSYCSPPFSSQWMNEINKESGYPLSTYTYHDIKNYKYLGKIPMEEESNPYVDAFWKWWPDLSRDLLFFRITGGEPLLSPSTFRVLESLHENPLPKLNLSLNSNLGVPEHILDKYLDRLAELLKFRKISSAQIHTSIDTWGKQAEYIRNGLKIDDFEKAVEKTLKKLYDSDLAFMCTFNALSLVGFREFLEKILDLRKRFNKQYRSIYLDIPHLQTPHHQAAKILTEDYHEMMESHIRFMEDNKDERTGFLDTEINKMKRVLDWMKQPISTGVMKSYRTNFYMFFTEHDRRRGTDFLGAFPEMEDFWELCKGLAEDQGLV